MDSIVKDGKGGEKTTGGQVKWRQDGNDDNDGDGKWVNDWTEADWGRNCWEQRWKGRKLPGPWRSTPLCFLLPTVTLLSNSWTLGRDDLSVQLVCVCVCVGNSRELWVVVVVGPNIILVGWSVGGHKGGQSKAMDRRKHACKRARMSGRRATRKSDESGRINGTVSLHNAV